MKNLPPASRFPGSGTLIEETRLRGRAEGCAAAVLRVLGHRGVEVPETARERIVSCADLTTQDTWLDRAFTVTRAEELFMEA